MLMDDFTKISWTDIPYIIHVSIALDEAGITEKH